MPSRQILSYPYHILKEAIRITGEIFNHSVTSSTLEGGKYHMIHLSPDEHLTIYQYILSDEGKFSTYHYTGTFTEKGIVCRAYYTRSGAFELISIKDLSGRDIIEKLSREKIISYRTMAYEKINVLLKQLIELESEKLNKVCEKIARLDDLSQACFENLNNRRAREKYVTELRACITLLDIHIPFADYFGNGIHQVIKDRLQYFLNFFSQDEAKQASNTLAIESKNEENNNLTLNNVKDESAQPIVVPKQKNPTSHKQKKQQERMVKLAQINTELEHNFNREYPSKVQQLKIQYELLHKKIPYLNTVDEMFAVHIAIRKCYAEATAEIEKACDHDDVETLNFLSYFYASKPARLYFLFAKAMNDNHFKVARYLLVNYGFLFAKDFLLSLSCDDIVNNTIYIAFRKRQLFLFEKLYAIMGLGANDLLVLCGEPLLCIAASEGALDYMKIFIKYGAPINSSSDIKYIVHKNFIENRKKFNHAHGKHKTNSARRLSSSFTVQPSLQAALDGGSIAAVKLLMAHGAELRTKDNFDALGYMTCDRNKPLNREIIDCLLSEGLSINTIQSYHDVLPLELHVIWGHESEVRLLSSELGADANCQVYMKLEQTDQKDAKLTDVILEHKSILTKALMCFYFSIERELPQVFERLDFKLTELLHENGVIACHVNFLRDMVNGKGHVSIISRQFKELLENLSCSIFVRYNIIQILLNQTEPELTEQTLLDSIDNVSFWAQQYTNYSKFISSMPVMYQIFRCMLNELMTKLTHLLVAYIQRHNDMPAIDYLKIKIATFSEAKKYRMAAACAAALVEQLDSGGVESTRCLYTLAKIYMNINKSDGRHKFNGRNVQVYLGSCFKAMSANPQRYLFEIKRNVTFANAVTVTYNKLINYEAKRIAAANTDNRVTQATLYSWKPPGSR